MRIMKAILLLVVALIFLVILLPGCSSTPIETPTQNALGQELPMPTVRTIPTLYPTLTTLPTSEPTSTRPPEPTEAPSTPINFEQIVVDVRYAIPAISLDRRIIGNVSSKIEVIDQISGESVIIPDQPGIMLELQQVLGQLELEELPDDCNNCVSLEYDLPLADKSGAGWLQDVQLLASLENFTTVHLDPHFPPGTQLGLRQSATPYQVAQTFAFTADGQLWRWRATDAQVTLEPTELLLSLLSDVPERQILDSLLQSDRVNCPVGPGVETLFIAIEDDVFLHNFTCPELTLASSLVPLYSNLDQLAAETVSESETPEPEPTIPLNSVLDFKQMDGSHLTLFRDGLAVLRTAEGITQTATLTGSLTISTTTALIQSNLLHAGVEGFLSEEEANVLFVRGPLGVYTLRWLEADNADLDIIFRHIEALRERVDSLVSDVDSITAEPTLSPTSTPDAE